MKRINEYIFFNTGYIIFLSKYEDLFTFLKLDHDQLRGSVISFSYDCNVCFFDKNFFLWNFL